MGWYSQQYHNVVGSDNDSLIIAFCNLLQNFDIEVKPAELLDKIVRDDQLLSWDSLTDFDEQIYPNEIGNYGEWPLVENSIVKFRVMSQRTGEPIDHYCLVVDPENHVVIDSLDGERKMPGVYGSPAGWASYVKDVTPLGPEDAVEDPPAPIEEAPEDPTAIKFVAYDSPVDMHISKEGGTKKYAFGRHDKWDRINTTGRNFKENQNVKIVAEAYVPVEDKIAKFYMEGVDFGNNYELTRRINWAIGFNHDHLEEGFVEEVVPEPTPEEVAEAEKKEDWFEELKRVSTDPETGEVNYMLFATTYKAFPDPEEFTIVKRPLKDGEFHEEEVGYTLYLANDNVMLHDFETKRPDRMLFKHKGIKLTGTFWHDGTQYGRPLRAADSWHWYGVPMDMVTKESEIFRTELTQQERVEVNKLYPVEKYWYIPLAQTLAQYTKLKTMLGKHTQKIRSK